MIKISKYIIVLIFGLFLINCSKNPWPEKYFQHTWLRSGDDKVIFKDGQFHQSTYFDTANYTASGDTILKYQIIDSLFIFPNSLRKYRQDTVIYEFIDYFGPKLILLSPQVFYGISILYSQEDFSIKETNNINSPRFEINGYSIGDTVNMNLVKEGNSWEWSNVISGCKLKSEPNVEFDIISDNYIYSIERMHIEDSEIDGVIQIITNKLGIGPVYTPIEKHSVEGLGRYTLTDYTWYKNGIYIQLASRNYIDYSYLNEKGWSLQYSNLILQGLLNQRFPNNYKEFGIIE